MYSAYPQPRLRHATPGDTVKLRGVSGPLFYAGHQDGYATLYKSKQRYLQGKMWDCIASMGHPIDGDGHAGPRP